MRITRRITTALALAGTFAALSAQAGNASEGYTSGGLTVLRVEDSIFEVDRSLNFNQGSGDTGSDVIEGSGPVSDD
ncbi:hypothetical protein A8924_1158 [Saccharopolyspora erythraea NRRL 2338]|uniref:Uncharacterized protein n=2 Tax=Saccharopolyspora erythraea TaxID=1836 RepID=A4F7S7_SACEN|nr:hypothetical protein [Saccharopolyspora erythraea]EQD83838.1 hypothetical protein N599_23255 [Saccharopolyspora erythraea D]PFG93900.1 hypothetical protein A8924_1158 [Saccharopolyspora erythraea NRRL 2338]QRK90727.1 hypothetical protein JQX30_04320 [Saccharopolyspora erythraea]CAM00101.1 hypothetical protein SACE_0760 [Saccharopolyspora erythraea NRRL 2338]